MVLAELIRPAARSVAPATRAVTDTDSYRKQRGAGPPNWRRGNGVQRQLEYALASFVKEMKKGEGSDG
jgi:hypothetical protein